MNVRAKLIGLALLALAPGLVIQGMNEIELRQSRQAEVTANALRSARSAAGELDRIVDSMKIVVTTLAESDAVRDRNPEKCDALVAAIKRDAPHLSTAGAIGLDGFPFCASLPVRQINVSDRGYFREALEKKTAVVGEFTVGRLLPAPVLPVAAPFHDRDGAVAGVVFATLSLEWLAAYFETRGFARETNTMAVTDRNGTILVRLPDPGRWVGRKLGQVYDRYVHAASAGTADIVAIDGVPRILGYVPVSEPPAGLYVGYALTREAAFASVEAATRRALVLLVAGAVLAVGLAYFFGRNVIVRPLERLSTVAERWSRGEFEARANLDGNDEFAALGRTADRMAGELNAMTSTLQERVNEETAARLKSDEALRHAEKLETLGQLAGGIAHDFNNFLHVIVNSLERLKRRTLTQGDVQSQRDADYGLQASLRATELVQRMLAFARRQPLAPQPIDANRMISDIGGLMSAGVGEGIQIQTVLGAGVWPVSADRGQLETALMNLAVNARDAMPKGGRMNLETANCYLDSSYAAAHDEVTPGQYVMFSVSDTGTGMSPDVVARAFDPFFTTKPVGQGTGMGLSQVYGFAKQSKGHVSIYSEPSQGTTVKLYLPRSAQSPVADGAEGAPRPATGDGKLILLVEDEADVRDYSQQMLSEAGYAVLAAADGPTALALLAKYPDVALLFTDVGLPAGMNGRVLADEARRQKPDLKVLFATGYARNAVVHDGRLDPGVELLVKPFSSSELIDRVARLLS